MTDHENSPIATPQMATAGLKGCAAKTPGRLPRRQRTRWEANRESVERVVIMIPGRWQIA